MKRLILEMLPRSLYLTIRRWHYKRNYKGQFLRGQAMRSTVTDHGYSYKPFDEKKAIFVHIPKCAGVSINKTIFGNLAGAHATLEEYLNVFEPRCIRSYFKFTFVRNPWDRLVSAYFFLKSGGFDEYDKNWADDELGPFSDFDQFVKKWIDKKNIWKWHHFRPQYHYMLTKSEKVSLDFVGFFENLDEDFNYIKKTLGIEGDLPKSNKSKHNEYQDYYNQETIQIVKEVYAEDIALLGYSFDNTSLSEQIARRRSIRKYTLRSF